MRVVPTVAIYLVRACVAFRRPCPTWHRQVVNVNGSSFFLTQTHRDRRPRKFYAGRGSGVGDA
jgi:hypothetical protein